MKTAIVVLNYNLPALTDQTCADIISRTKSDYDLYVIENGSDPNNLSKYCTNYIDTNLWVSGGLNYGIRLAMEKEDYAAIWCLFNDVKFAPQGDVLSLMLSCMKKYPRIGIIKPSWGNEWLLNESPLSNRNYADPAISLAYAADPLCMLFRTSMIKDISKKLGPLNRPLWDESNKRNHGNAQLVQYMAYRHGWGTLTTNVFTTSETSSAADQNSLMARGEEDAVWKSKGTIECEAWIRKRWKDISFFYSPNLLGTTNFGAMMRHFKSYIKMWYQLSNSNTSEKYCRNMMLNLCQRECENFLLRYPEYAKLSLDEIYNPN